MKPITLWAGATVITLAGVLAVAVLLSSADTAAAADTRGVVEVRSEVPSAGHRVFARRPVGRRHMISPIVGASAGFDPVTTAPSAPVVILQQAPPVYIQPEPPPPLPQSSYSWYYCGPNGEVPSPTEHAPPYCLGGITPNVTMLPGPGKTRDRFKADDMVCQHWASERAATLPGTAFPQDATSSGLTGTVQGRYDTAYQQCMSAKANRSSGETSPARPEYGTPPPPSPR